MTDKDNEQLANLGEPEHIIRQRLREDQDTQKIAEALGIDVDAYITQVLYYARRPNLEPEVEVIDDAELSELDDVDLPTEGEVFAWLDAVEQGEIDLLGPEKGLCQETAFTKEVDYSEKNHAALGVRHDRAAPELSVRPKKRNVRAEPGSILEQQLLLQQQAARVRSSDRRSAQAKKG